MVSATTNQSPGPALRLGTIGNEASPLAVIDEFMPDPEALRESALARDWQIRGDFYPGPRAEAEPDYLVQMGRILRLVLPQVFGPVRSAQVLRCYYSLATTRPEQLTLPQRIPHVDSYDPCQIALVHYLCPAEFGGTAFFRHTTTGFETIDEERSAIYVRSLEADFARHGQPPAAYIDAHSTGFEQIGKCPAAFNRAVLFPGNLLHCADLAGVNLPCEPHVGRLTIAAFIRLH
jgi:Family of unknown function (DUF6445)